MVIQSWRWYWKCWITLLGLWTRSNHRSKCTFRTTFFPKNGWWWKKLRGLLIEESFNKVKALGGCCVKCRLIQISMLLSDGKLRGLLNWSNRNMFKVHFMFFTAGGGDGGQRPCACAVALHTTAISKHGGGRRQCCESVSLPLFLVGIKRAARRR